MKMNDEEIEEKLREFFEENFQILRDSSGHSINDYLKEKAFQQVLYFWKKNKNLIEKITESEVKLSLPEQKTPNEKIPFTLEGIVDIVKEDDETWLYDLKTHDKDRIEENIDFYKEQLFIYAYIWKNLQGHSLDNTAVISTPLPERLTTAIKKGNLDAMERELKSWDPVIPLGYSEEEVERMINNFGEVVEAIEKCEYEPRDTEVLLNQTFGEKSDGVFGSKVCRMCDVRFSCKSYAEFLKESRGASKNEMYKYMCARSQEDEDFVEDVLVDEVKK